MTRVLLVEDDPSICLALSDKLATLGFQVAVETRGDAAWKRLAKEAPELDLVLLDVMLPGLDGIEILRRLREARSPVPVLMLTARGLESDRVLGLEVGADDYVTKPFSVRELVARMRAILRRGAPGTGQPAGQVTFGALQIDFAAFRLRRGKKEHALSPLERDMLRLLVERQGEVVSRERFLREIWGLDGNVSTRTVDFHIRQLRLKVESDPAKPAWIRTVHGAGYRFEPPGR